jgi:hypothetical protein
MIRMLAAPSYKDLICELAEECVRLGRLGALLDHVETRLVSNEGVEVTLQYRWAELDEPTYTRRTAREVITLKEGLLGAVRRDFYRKQQQQRVEAGS